MPIYATPQDVMEAIEDSFKPELWYYIVKLPCELFTALACKHAGYTLDEIGEKEKISRKAVERRINKAISMLHDFMQ